MSFPLRIERGVKPELRFNNEAALGQWIEQETSAWAWLVNESRWTMAEQSLFARVAEIQYTPLETLRALCEEPAPLAPGIIAVMQAELEHAYVTGKAMVSTDPGVADLIENGKSNPAFGLGMLAQAIGVAVENESAEAFAGRQAWLNTLPGALASGISERIETLDRQLKEADSELRRKQTNNASYQALQAFKSARNRNGWWMAGLTALAMAWIFAAGQAAEKIHALTTPQSHGSNASTLRQEVNPQESKLLQGKSVDLKTPAMPVHTAAATRQASTVPNVPTNAATISPLAVEPAIADASWSWPQLTERFTLYLLLITAFGWGLRWIGRFFQDAWSAGQSASRRWLALTVVLDDNASVLFKYDEKGMERIRMEIFDDMPPKSPATDKESQTFSVELLDKLLDAVKKARDIAAPGK